mgnify:CR=1 FL=1
MTTDCNCSSQIKRQLDSARREALSTEKKHQSSLVAMKDAIIEGANERIARALFTAGVYKTSDQKDFSMNIDSNEVLTVLESQLRSKTEYSDLFQFLKTKRSLILDQADMVEPRELLKRIVRKIKIRKPTLEKNFIQNLQKANSTLQRANKLKTHLESWKENLHLQDKIRSSKIFDVHDDNNS